VNNIKLDLGEKGWGCMDWIDLEGSFEYGHELSGFIKCWEVLEWLRSWWPLGKDYSMESDVPCSLSLDKTESDRIQWRDLLNTAMNLEIPAKLRLCFKALENTDDWKFPLGLYSMKLYMSNHPSYILFTFTKFVKLIQFKRR
jgi:hypothetical protein